MRLRTFGYQNLNQLSEKRRLRCSFREPMGIIVALALTLIALSPLYHLSLPPCLTPLRAPPG